MQPALLENALELGAVNELWWYGTVTQVRHITATTPTTQLLIQFELGRAGELSVPQGQEGLLDNYTVHDGSSELVTSAAEPYAHRMANGLCESWVATDITSIEAEGHTTDPSKFLRSKNSKTGYLGVRADGSRFKA